MEPIAIIGLSCRFPGAETPEAFWQLLRNGVDAITEVPAARWDVDAFYDPEPAIPEKMNTRWSGFLKQVDQFEPSFFGISPREAQHIDPQQRLLLEVAWEALENAAIVPDSLAGSQTGVFIGVSNVDYRRLLSQDLSFVEAYSGTGTAFSIAANRLSYLLNLKGPSLSLDTACSSSLVALHYACGSLLSLESNLCLVGGVNLILSPEPTITFSHAGMMAADGRCKTFDASADGYVRGEGCGVVVLKRLSDALKDGDRIRAVIRSSAVNQDGLSNGLTAPNGPSQQALIRQALATAGVKPAQISYVEAHGTGTSLGDPIEVNSLKKVLLEGRQPEHPLVIGSVKTNIGHLESAAGIAGVIKVVLSLENQEIPPHLHLKQLNPYIRIKNTPIQIPTEIQPWQTGTNEKLAGVSSFGFGGTNAHVIVESAPIQKSQVKAPEVGERPWHVLTLSAKCEAALLELTQRYQKLLADHDELAIADLCFSANTGRSHFQHRLAIIASTKLELAQKLDQISIQEEVAGIFSGKLSNNKTPKIAFLFTGQGSQYINMGRQLYDNNTIFRQTLDQCASILEEYLDQPLLEILYGESASESILGQTGYTQVALFAVEYALYQLWTSWGITPNVVMGHSVGEYVAATVAGVWSLEEGLKLIAHRGRLMQQLPTGGTMLSVRASLKIVQPLVDSYSGQVSIAAINGAESVVISGEQSAIAQIQASLESQSLKTKQLEVSHGFHSHLMEPMLAEFEQVAASINYQPPQISLVSNVTGKKVDPTSIATPEYWVNHVRQPVQFAQSITTLHQLGYQVFLEIGSRPILLGMGRQCFPEEEGVWLPSLRPNQSDWQQMLNSLGELYVRGVKVNWRGFDQDYLRRRVILPTYPFQRQRYWLRSSHYQKLTQKQSLTTGQTIHPFLGEKLNCAGEQKIFTAFLSKESPAYLRHHQVFSQAVFPTTAYLEMAVALGNHLWKQDSVIIEQLSIRQGLIFPTAELRKVQTILTPDHNHSYQLQIYSQPQDKEAELEWILHATALVRKEEARSQADINLRQYQDNCSQAIDVLQHYQQCRRMGLNYGSSFQGIKQLWAGSNQALGLIQLPAELVGNTTDYHLHPALLDAALQVSLQISSATSREQTYLPVGVEEFQIYGTPGLELWAYASFTEETRENQDSQKINVVLISPQGELVASIKALEVKLVTASALMGTQAESITDWLYEIDWRSQGLLGRLGAPDFLLPPKSIAQKLAPELKELVNQINDNRTSDLVSSLEELCLDYIVQGLLEIGWSYSVGETFDPDAAASRWGVVPSQMRLFQHLLQVLSARGILESTAQQWQVQRTLESVNPTAKNQSLQHQFPDEEATLNLLDRCASQLYRVLRGAADPVPLVFPPGDLTTSAHMDDDDAPVAQVINTMMQQAITQATAQLPAYRGLRLLEIGAGTGGTTSYILPHLNPHQAQYSFTDLERSYTAKAQARFLNYQFLDYQTLDIEQDPSSQEFASHHYDVVVAANVLHETTNIQEALSNVKQLLAPGGILVLSEATAPRLWLDLTYGLLAGWWKFQDHELRPDYPLLDCSQWQEVLAESGFTEIAALPEIGETAVIVARAPKIEPAVSTAKNWLLLADERGIAQQLAEQITSAGDVCTLVFPGSKYHQVNATEFRINPHNPAEYEQLIAELSSSRSLHGVVQCWSTTSETDKAMDSEELEQLSFLGCGTTLSLVQALVGGELSSAPRLWLVSCGSQPVPMTQPVIPAVAQSSLWGIGKVISLEHPELNCRRIDLDPEQSIEQQAQALFEEIWAEDREDQVAWRGDTRYVARLIPSSYQQDQHLIPSEPFKLKIAQKGNLDSLTFEAVTRRSPGLGEVEIRVKATGMNFRDVLIALDIYPGEPILGGDCAGEIVAVGTGVTGLKVGDSVIAMAPGSFSKYVTLNASYVVLKPENLNFEQAASIPVNFLTAEYALHHLAKITPGDKVLIHAAAGGTGMAAVQIAQAAGAEVFATASPGKWSVLKEMGVQHVMNSRTLEFAEQIMSLTEGEGVDIVLNSLTSGEFISRSVDVLNSQGRFIELALRDIWNYERMKESKPNIAYLPMNLFEISQRQPQLIKKLLQKLMDQLSNGLLQPPPLQAFTLERIIDAFRYMQQAKHIGKIVVTQTAESDEADTQKSLSFLSDATYLITGGTGGLGLTVAEWMISKGAKNLVLVARSSPNAAAKSQLTELEQTGAKVVLEKADVSDATAMKDILHRIKNSKVPLAGIIHAAGMLSDGVLVNQTWSSFEEVMAAKVQGAWHLHQLTQNQPLDFFVLFSSISSLFGSSGQGNYAAANGFLDGLAHYRRARGLPGLSINWGAISQVGQAAQRGADIRLARQGIGVISPTQVLECLELMMADTANAEGNVPPAEVGMVPIDWSAWREAVTQWSFLSDWQNITRTASQSSDSEFLLKLQATAPEERYALLVAHIRRQLSLVLGINNPESISLEAVFFDLGMDSLTAVELRNKLQTSLGCSVPSTIVFDYPTVGELVDYLAQEMLNIELADTSVTKSPEAKEEKQAESQMQELAEAQQLSEEDLEQKIKDKLNLLITEES